MQHDELQLIVQCKNGDTDAFALLYDSYVRKIYDFIYYRTFHQQVAEDLTSACFFKALGSMRQFDETKASFQTWLYTIARNTVIDYMRSPKNQNGLDDIYDPLLQSLLVAEDNPENITDIQFAKEHAAEIMSRIPEEWRDLLVMRLWDELSYAEIAVITGKSENSLKTKYSRIIRDLKELYEKQ